MTSPVTAGTDTTSTGARAGDQVQVHRDDGVLRLVINRPDTLNAVDSDVLDDLADAVEAAGTDPDVAVIVLSGAGRGFCAGADIGGGRQDQQDAPAATLDAAIRLVGAVRDCDRPVVSVVQGPCAGVGVAVALSADLVLASSKAFFMLAFAKIGLMPDGGATALVSASAGRAKAMRMALLAERMTATEAESVGLVSHVFDAETFDADVTAVVDTLRHGPRVAYARTKAAINAATLAPLDAAFEREREGQLDLLASSDFAEGTAAFRDKRPPEFTDRA